MLDLSVNRHGWKHNFLEEGDFWSINQSWTQICKGTIMAQLLFWIKWSKVTKLGLALLLFL